MVLLVVKVMNDVAGVEMMVVRTVTDTGGGVKVDVNV